MTLIRKSALALYLAFLSTSYSNSQDITNTGNLVNFTSNATDVTSTWQNAGTIGSPLTCWSGGGQGYCGPLPRVATGGQGSNSINFSYGLTDLNQTVNIKNALPNTGTGLQVNGFNFGFTAKNGNGWDDGRQDYLTAYVNIYNNTNSKVVEAYSYNVNQRYNWTQFYWSETFNTPYAVPDLGNAVYGLVGKDNNYWVGPYGPEVINVNFSLKYSVDPCATNPLYSPSCKGYMDALAKLAPTPVAVADTAPPPAPDDGAPPPPGSAPAPGNNPPPGPSNGLPPPPPGSAPAPAGSQPRPNETKSAKEDSKAGPSLGNVLSMISSNQARIGNEAKSVVQAAESQAAKDAQQAQDQAEAVAGSLTAQSVASSMTSSNESGTTAKSNSQSQTSSMSLSLGTTSATSSMVSIRPPTQTSSSETTQSTGTGLTMPMAPYQYNSTSTESNSFIASIEISSLNFGFQLPTGRTTTQVEIETPQLEGIKIGTRSVLNDAIEERPVTQNTNSQEQKSEMVNRNVQSNDLAGAVDIAKMATQPAGYQSYSVVMPDVAFYAPKEIYKNQVNVDNARLLRGLGSDRLHQEMINQQYKLGN